MNKCKSGKVCYFSQSEAEEALLQLRGKYEFQKGKGPIGVYHCDICHGYHLTSKGNNSEFLESKENQRKIELLKEAEKWSNKWK